MTAMPLLAYAVTTVVLVPHLQKALRGAGPAGAETEAPFSTKGAASSAQRESAPLNKLLVNVAGTLGSRYLLTSLTMMGSGSDFPRRITEKEPQLRDLATSILSAKTIADIEKPGARNLIRGELLAGFNTILGDPGVQEIYFTEFAVQ
jgi:flagellar FliL protein